MKKIHSEKDLIKTVEEYGFLPLLASVIPGFSVEEHTSPDCWFIDGIEGPWEWKGPVIRETDCAYGKFFNGKAGFITKEWFYDFANYRRDGYDLDARYEDGLLRPEDKLVYDVLAQHKTLLSKGWRRLTGIEKRGDFDAAVRRLQMLGYVTTIDFEYALTRKGEPYGWGLARYATCESHFGKGFETRVYKRTPEESYKRILRHLKNKLPDIPEDLIRRLLG